MKPSYTLFFLALIAGCSAPKDPAAAPESAAVPAPPAAVGPTPAQAPSTASATGVVQAIDPAARTITIAHGPVESLKWPGMTMTFQAPDADLAVIKVGDNVTFEFTSTGMDGRIVSITKQ